ncbi:MAG: hypothetical protein V4479_13250 [Actinomycetota bacterium]
MLVDGDDGLEAGAKAIDGREFIANEAEKIVDYEQVNRAIQVKATLGLAGTPEQKEAIAAFREKRLPVFTKKS